MTPAQPDPGTTPSGEAHSGAARRTQPQSGPTLSAVLVSHGALDALGAALRALVPQCERHRVQLVVARGGLGADTGDLAAQFPAVTFVAVSGSVDEKTLRAAGMRAASGDIVAFTSDATPPDTDWLASLFARSQVIARADEQRRSSGRQRARRSGPSSRVTPSSPS